MKGIEVHLLNILELGKFDCYDGNIVLLTHRVMSFSQESRFVSFKLTQTIFQIAAAVVRNQEEHFCTMLIDDKECIAR